MFTRKTKLIAASGIIGLAGLSIPALSSSAFAASCPDGSTCTQQVSGTVTIPTTLTLTLAPNGGNTADSFSLDTTAGGTVEVGDPSSYSAPYIPGGGTPPNGGGAPVTATVTTNDPTGYVLQQAITSTNGDFEGSHGLGGSDVIPASDVSQLDFPANMVPGQVTWGPFAGGGAPNQIGSNDQAVSGDLYFLGYQVTVPPTAEADTYNATFTVTALAN